MLQTGSADASHSCQSCHSPSTQHIALLLNSLLKLRTNTINKDQKVQRMEKMHKQIMCNNQCLSPATADGHDFLEWPWSRNLKHKRSRREPDHILICDEEHTTLICHSVLGKPVDKWHRWPFVRDPHFGSQSSPPRDGIVEMLRFRPRSKQISKLA